MCIDEVNKRNKQKEEAFVHGDSMLLTIRARVCHTGTYIYRGRLREREREGVGHTETHNCKLWKRIVYCERDTLDLLGWVSKF